MSGFGFQPVNYAMVANAAIAQYHMAVGSQNGTCDTATVDTGVIVGVVQNAPLANEFAGICPFGDSQVIAGGAISYGARITCNSIGRATAAGSGDTIVGFAREAAVANGDNIKAFIIAAQDKMIS